MMTPPMLAFLIVCLSTLLVPSTALLAACTTEEANASTCWGKHAEQCVLGGECDVPDPDMDKTCAEEQEILDEAVACCPQCNQEVKAIRSCRCPSSESGPPPAPETTNPPAPTPPVPSPPTAGGGDNEDDPTSQLPLCKDELSVVDNCYATNIDQCDNCDAYDSDTDKTCSEEEGVLNDFVSCCGVCSSQGVDVYDCRCGGASTEGISGVGRVSASHKFSTAITAIVFIGSSVAF